MTIKAHIDYGKILGIAEKRSWLTRASLFDGEDLRKAVYNISDKETFETTNMMLSIAKEIKRLSDTGDDLRTILEMLLQNTVTLYTANWEE